MFAVAKARFMIACDSGPTAYATAFKTPLFKTNTFTEDGAFSEGDLLLAKNIVNWRGEVLDLGPAFESRFVFFKGVAGLSSGVRLVDNSLAQLQHGVDLMLARTHGGGWRADTPPDPRPPPEAIVWPTRDLRRSQMLNLAHLLGAPVRTVPIA
jgi:hypothetical protein